MPPLENFANSDCHSFGLRRTPLAFLRSVIAVAPEGDWSREVLSSAWGLKVERRSGSGYTWLMKRRAIHAPPAPLTAAAFP